jgi:hypothetical protein
LRHAHTGDREMPTLIGWLEAGRRLAERIPYSLVALIVI